MPMKRNKKRGVPEDESRELYESFIDEDDDVNYDSYDEYDGDDYDGGQGSYDSVTGGDFDHAHEERLDYTNLAPPENLLSAKKVSKVKFIPRNKGYDYRNVEAFVEQTYESLLFFERLVEQKDTDISSLEDQIDELLEEKSTLQSTIEVFKEYGDPIVDSEGNYVLSGGDSRGHANFNTSTHNGASIEELELKNAYIRELEEEVQTLKDVQATAKTKIEELKNDLNEAVNDYEELRKWVDDNLESIKEKELELESLKNANMEATNTPSTSDSNSDNDLRSELEHYKKTLESLENQLEKVMNEKENLETLLATEKSSPVPNTNANGEADGGFVIPDWLTEEMAMLKAGKVSAEKEKDKLQKQLLELSTSTKSGTATNDTHDVSLEEKHNKATLEKENLLRQIEVLKGREDSNIDDTNRALSALEMEKEQREIAENKVRELLKKVALVSKNSSAWEKEKLEFDNIVNDLRAQILNLENEHSEEVSLLEEETRKLRNKNKELEVMCDDLRNDIKQAQGAQDEIDELALEKRKVESSLSFYKEKYYDLKNTHDNLVVEHEIAKEDIAKTTGVSLQVAELKQDKVTLEETLRVAKKEKHTQDLTMQQLQSELLSKENDIKALKVERSRLEEKLKNKEDEIMKLTLEKEESSEWEVERGRLLHQVGELEETLAMKETLIESLQSSHENLREELEKETLRAEESISDLEEYITRAENAEKIVENFKGMLGGMNTVPGNAREVHVSEKDEPSRKEKGTAKKRTKVVRATTSTPAGKKTETAEHATKEPATDNAGTPESSDVPDVNVEHVHIPQEKPDISEPTEPDIEHVEGSTPGKETEIPTTHTPDSAPTVTATVTNDNVTSVDGEEEILESTTVVTEHDSTPKDDGVAVEEDDEEEIPQHLLDAPEVSASKEYLENLLD